MSDRVDLWSKTHQAQLTPQENPVLLTKKSAHWNAEVYYPIPIQYFLNIHDHAFWTSYIPKRGTIHVGKRYNGASLTSIGMVLQACISDHVSLVQRLQL